MVDAVVDLVAALDLVEDFVAVVDAVVDLVAALDVAFYFSVAVLLILFIKV